MATRAPADQELMDPLAGVPRVGYDCAGKMESTQMETERSESRAAQADPPLERRERPQRSEPPESQRTSGSVTRSV